MPFSFLQDSSGGTSLSSSQFGYHWSGELKVDICQMKRLCTYSYNNVCSHMYTRTHTHTHTRICTDIQGMHKRRVRFQKVTRNVFLTLHGHNVHRQQRQLFKFLMRYQQFPSHAYCGASFQDGVAAGNAFCVLRFEVSRSVITVQCTV